MRASLAADDALKRALAEIEADSVPRVFWPQKWRFWSYERLARLAGSEDDWRYDGRFRNAITGPEARTWLQEQHRLWWTAEVERHSGLMFTADCRTGVDWDRRRVADRIQRDAAYLAETARRAESMQPVFRAHFRELGSVADRLVSSSIRLDRIGANGRTLAASANTPLDSTVEP